MITIIQTAIQALGLLSLVLVGITYYLDRRWRRAEAAYKFYNEFEVNNDCRRAMFMLDYQADDTTYEFDYEFLKLSKVVQIQYNRKKLDSAMSKPYERLTEEEQVIRFIFDVYIGYLERVFYLIKTGYFTENELFFYKYWLDILVSDEYKDIRDYAKQNSCGLFVPFLEHYKNKIQPKFRVVTKIF